MKITTIGIDLAKCMPTLHVVERLDVVEYVGPRISPRRIDLALDPLEIFFRQRRSDVQFVSRETLI